MQIPSLIAIRLGSEPELSEGDSFPLKLECASIDAIESPETYVVKFGTNVTGGYMGIASEIIAGSLATHFEISVPKFCLIEITDSFADALAPMLDVSDRVLTNINQNVRGYNFGSLVINDTKLPLPLGHYSTEQIEVASRIFAFDALIYNADRTEITPNVFSVGESFVIYDHDKGFNFIFNNPLDTPKILDFRLPNGNAFMHEHIFHRVLHGKEIDFGHFIEKLEGLEDDIIIESIDKVPYNIKKDHKEEIKAIEDHLKFVRESTRDFRLNLMRVLK